MRTRTEPYYQNENVSSDYGIAEDYAKILEREMGCECIVDTQEEILLEM